MSESAMDDIKTVLARIEGKADRVVRAIEGDPTVGHKGLAQRMEVVEAEVSANGKKMIAWGGIVTGISLTLEAVKNRLLG